MALNVGSLRRRNLSGAEGRLDLYKPSQALIVGACGFCRRHRAA